MRTILYPVSILNKQCLAHNNYALEEKMQSSKARYVVLIFFCTILNADRTFRNTRGLVWATSRAGPVVRGTVCNSTIPPRPPLLIAIVMRYMRMLSLPRGDLHGMWPKIGLGVLATHRKEHESWPSRDPEELAKLLIPWSEKQVRDNFHRLYQLNLITAKRARANKTWQYYVPETLIDGVSAFRQLPTPEAPLTGDFPSAPHTTAPGAATARPPTNCPNVWADLSNGSANT
jgi:hypothetical protein